MPISPSDFQINISPTPLNCVMGHEIELNIYSSNISSSENCYNLAYVITIPDAVSYVSASIPETSISHGSHGTTIISFTNIKNLAYNELDYLLTIKLHSDTTFSETGLPVPFDIPLFPVSVIGTVDTLPRGNDDIGNQVISKTLSTSLIPKRYGISKSSPGKQVKGAGKLDPLEAPLWIFKYEIKLLNSESTSSVVTLIDYLPNGIRYLGNLTVNGPDAAQLNAPTVYPPSLLSDHYTLDWGTVMLSINSTNTITFEAAIWDRYTENGVENSGAPIPHGIPLVNQAIMNGAQGPVSSSSRTNAMDATINKHVSTNHVDVGDTITYTLVYKINQYDELSTFTMIDTLCDGLSYDTGSASLTPDSVTQNLDGTTSIEWGIGFLTTGSSATITFTATVLPNYINNEPVVSDDNLLNYVTIDGFDIVEDTPTPDSSSATVKTIIPYVTKKLLGYYNKDGTPKTTPIATPGDLVEFEVSYYSTNINASAENVQITEFAPLNMGPLSSLSISYGGNVPGPFTPFTISPNGLRWDLGIVSGNSTWTATYKIPVLNTVFVGKRNNLVTLNAENTLGITYSDRDQVEVSFGSPNIAMQKTLTPSGLLSYGTTYTYTVTVSNLQDSSGLVTDAFNMTLTDVLPNGMSYVGAYTVTGTGSYNTPVFSGQNISLLITKLATNQTLVFKYNVTLDNGVAAGISLRNDAVLTRPYSQPDSSFQYPGEPLKASVSRRVVSSTVTKSSSATKVAVGEDFVYTITVNIPRGTTLYAPQITDTLPTNEVYVGSATVQVPPAAPVSVTPIVSGQTVTFPNYSNVTATGSAYSLIYKFTARATSATHVPPYEDSHTNNVLERWYLNSGLTQSLTANANTALTVTTPNIRLLKEQRNFTQGTPFTTDQIILQDGDIMHYRITVISDGASTAYNIDLRDVLPVFTNYYATIIPPTIGTISLIGSPGAEIGRWQIPALDAGSTAVLVFAVELLLQTASESLINNFGGGYNSYNSGAPVYYTAQSNTVVALAPNLGFYKTVSKSIANIGETIRYCLNLTIPEGIRAYNLKIEDVLPLGEKYAGNAKRNQYDITPTIVGQTVSFPTEDIIGPFSKTTTIVYCFDSLITTGPERNNIETHVNHATLNWDLSPQGPPAKPILTQVNITITNEQPKRGIFIEDISDFYEKN